MLRRPPRSTRTEHSFPTRRSSDLQIELLLENAVVVAWALVIGGFGILLVERFAKPRESGGVAALSTRQSILIGIVQCLAMIPGRSEEPTSELQSLMRRSYAVFCLKKKQLN